MLIQPIRDRVQWHCISDTHHSAKQMNRKRQEPKKHTCAGPETGSLLPLLLAQGSGSGKLVISRSRRSLQCESCQKEMQRGWLGAIRFNQLPATREQTHTYQHCILTPILLLPSHTWSHRPLLSITRRYINKLEVKFILLMS